MFKVGDRVKCNDEAKAQFADANFRQVLPHAGEVIRVDSSRRETESPLIFVRHDNGDIEAWDSYWLQPQRAGCSEPQLPSGAFGIRVEWDNGSSEPWGANWLELVEPTIDRF